VYVAARAPGDEIAQGVEVTATTPAEVALYAVLEAKDGDGRTWWITAAPRVKLRGRKVQADRVLPPAVLTPLGVVPVWNKFEPTEGSYSDRDTPLAWTSTPWGEGWRRPADVHPTILADQFPEHLTGLGVMRFQVTVQWGERSLASPAIQRIQDAYGDPEMVFTAKW
jgi:hypothetical protein